MAGTPAPRAHSATLALPRSLRSVRARPHLVALEPDEGARSFLLRPRDEVPRIDRRDHWITRRLTPQNTDVAGARRRDRARGNLSTSVDQLVPHNRDAAAVRARRPARVGRIRAP